MHAFGNFQFVGLVAGLLGLGIGCAAAPQYDERERIDTAEEASQLRGGGVADCIVQDYGDAGGFQTRYCWVEYAPASFPRETRTPFINTYLEGPGFRLSNPLAWGFGVGPGGSFGISLPWAYPQVGEGYVQVQPTAAEESPGEPPEFEEESPPGTQPAPPEPGTTNVEE